MNCVNCDKKFANQSEQISKVQFPKFNNINQNAQVNFNPGFYKDNTFDKNKFKK